MILVADQEWRAPPSGLTLSDSEVHVWRAGLDVPASCVQAFQNTLAPDEQQRAAQFHFPHLRQRFIAGRGMLRAILGSYLGVAPQAIRFGYTSYGKPFLAQQEGRALLSFNVTHAEGMALYAVTQERAVGVDIETYRQLPDAEAIAERFFSPLENCSLRALPVAERPRAFLRCWTRKEAYIKAQGMGLTLPLDQFSVTLAPDESAQLLHTNLDSAVVEHWVLRDLAPGPGYVAAVAVEGHDWQLACWQWSS